MDLEQNVKMVRSFPIINGVYMVEMHEVRRFTAQFNFSGSHQRCQWCCRVADCVYMQGFVVGTFWQESLVNMQMGGNITGKVRIMYRPIAIKTSWRIKVDNNVILNIAGPPINLGGENKYLEIKVRQTE
jgi:hypothetical protein